MNNKLTLRMDESLIASAKNYAAANGSSVSQMVANYFAALEQTSPFGSQGNPAVAQIRGNKPTSVSGPVTSSLVGILKPKAGNRPVDAEDYHAYLESKYLGDAQGRSL